MAAADTRRSWPAGSASWFVCRAKNRVTDVTIPLKAGVECSEAEAEKEGRMRAARYFKRLHGLHPCTKVECEFQFIELPEASA